MLPVLQLGIFLELYLAASTVAGDAWLLGDKIPRCHKALRDALPFCAAANLVKTEAHIKHALSVFEIQSTPLQKQNAVKGLPPILHEELVSQPYLCIKPLAKGLLWPAQLPDNVKGLEREAAEEAYAAMRCLGLGEPTACVLHITRVFEWGAKVVANSLNIDSEPLTMGGIATEVQRVVRERCKNGDLDSYAEQMYNRLVVDINAFAKAYRNPTLHGFEHYNEQEALELTTHVGGFIRDLGKAFGPDLNNPKMPKKR